MEIYDEIILDFRARIRLSGSLLTQDYPQLDGLATNLQLGCKLVASSSRELFFLGRI